jgi:hypothetical protein
MGGSFRPHGGGCFRGFRAFAEMRQVRAAAAIGNVFRQSLNKSDVGAIWYMCGLYIELIFEYLYSGLTNDLGGHSA